MAPVPKDGDQTTGKAAGSNSKQTTQRRGVKPLQARGSGENSDKGIELGLHVDSDSDLARLGLPEWIIVEREIGHDPWNRSGANFDAYAQLGIRVICRLVHGAAPKGTLPFSQNYGAFARRCANFVAASSGCQVWIIGHEPNHRGQWPAVSYPGDMSEQPSESGANAAFRAAESHALDPAHVHEAQDDLDQPHSPRVRSWWQRLISSLPGRSLSGRSSDGGLLRSDSTTGQQAGQRNPDSPSEEVSTTTRVDNRSELTVEAGDARDTGIPAYTMPAYTEVISPRKYVACYRLCRRAIRAVPGHENDLVLPAGLAPWTDHAAYAANPRGEWITYFRHMTGLLSAQECDGFALHLYTNPGAKQESSRQEPASEWVDYGELLAAIPESMQTLPVFITECGPDSTWNQAEEGWLDWFLDALEAFWQDKPNPLRMCAPRPNWHPNQRSNRQSVSSLTPELATSIGLLSRLRAWEGAPISALVGHRGPGQTPIRRNDIVVTTTVVNMRRLPGYLDKDTDDVIAELAGGVRLEILDAVSTTRDGLAWWRARVAQGTETRHAGWLAETAPDGRLLLARVTGSSPGSIRQGSKIRALLPARVRRSRGYLGKPDNDVLGEAPAGSIWLVRAGPADADDLSWWEIEGETSYGPLRGWVAETAPGGLQLFSVDDAPGETDSGDDNAGSGRGIPPEGTRGQFGPGDRVITLAYVRLRRSPGYLGKSAEDVIADIWLGTDVVILTPFQSVDDLVWYEVETRMPDGPTVRGWMAERSPDGMTLLGVREARYEETFALGELAVVGSAPLRVRRSPGVNDKAENDVLGEFYPRGTLNILSDAQNVDEMRWWRVGGIATHGAVRGWVAQSTAQGVALVRRPPHLPGTSIPDRGAGRYLHRPFAGRFGISQLWGERRDFYARFTYDGVPLLGHNGIDFLTPMHTPILATEGGVVSAAAFEPGGFGHYVLMEHAWGQSIYAHLDSVAVGNGQSVTRGQTLGRSGSSGNSSGPHLHFAIRIHPYDRADGWGGFSDPLPYMSPADVILPAYVQDEVLQDVWPKALLDLINAEPLPPPGMAEETPGMIRP